MAHPLRRYLLLFNVIGLILSLPLIAEYFGPGDALHDISGHQYGRDFINVWGGARLVLNGGVMTLFDYEAYYRAIESFYGAEIPFHNWSYPPHILPFVALFGALPYFPGLAVWTVAGFCAYAAVALSPLTGPARRWGLLALALAPATLVNAAVGQNGFFSAALLLGAVALMDRRPWVAGVLLGLLTVKPHLGLLIGVLVLADGAWRTAAAAALTAAAAGALSLVLWGPDPWIGFATKTTALTRFYFDHFQGFYTYMMPSVFASARLLGLPVAASALIQAVVSLAVIVTTAIAWRRTRDIAIRALLVAAGTLLVSPYAFNYDMTLLTAAMLWTAVSRPGLLEANRWVFGLAWLLPVLIWPLHLWGIGIAPLIIGAVFAVATGVAMGFRNSGADRRQPLAASA